MNEAKLHPIHPGEVLLEEFLKPMGLSQSRLALDISVHPRRINEIVLGKRSITADTALRLARFFGTSARFWLGLQMDYDLDVTADALGPRLDQEIKRVVSGNYPQDAQGKTRSPLALRDKGEG
jgi:addiction module HigA family antidote